MNSEVKYRPTWLTGDQDAAATQNFGGFPFLQVGEFFLTENSQVNRRKVWQGHCIDWNVRLRFYYPGAEKETNTVYAVTIDRSVKYIGLTRNAIEHRWGLNRKQALELPHYGYSFFIWHSDVADYAIQAALGMIQGTQANLQAPAVGFWLCENPYRIIDGNFIPQYKVIESAAIRKEQPEWNTVGK